MKFLQGFLSDETIETLKSKLGDDLVNSIDEKLADVKLNAGKEKMIPKTVYDSDKAELKKQIEDRDKQLDGLLEKAKGNDSLTLQIKELQETNTKTVADYEQKLKAISQTHAYEKALADFKPKNLKALDGVIDKSKLTYSEENGEVKVTGLQDQIDALKKTDAYLFEGNTQTAPIPQNNNNLNKSNSDADTATLDAFGLSAED